MLRLKAILLYILAFTLLVTPIGFLIYKRRDVYFAESEPMQITLGLIIALAFAMFMILKGFGSLNKDFKTLITLGTLTAIVTMLSVFVVDLNYIMPMLFIGWALFIPPKWAATRYWYKANIRADQYIKEQVKRDLRKDDLNDGSA